MTTFIHPFAARILAVAATVALLGAAAPPAAAVGERAGSSAPGAADDTTVPGAFIVTTADAGAADLGGRLTGRLGYGPSRAAVAALTDRVARVAVDPRDAEEARRALLALPGVVAVEPERVYTYTAEPDDPRYGDQWSHRVADAPGAWKRTTGGEDVRIAIVDSGIDARHPDLAERVSLQARIVRNAHGGYSVVGGQPDNDGCGEGHGTMVAGVAAAAGDNGIGIAGVAWEAQIIDIALSAPTDASGGCDADERAPTDGKVISALGHLSSDTFRQAHGRVDVVNLSLGGRQYTGRCPTGLQSAIDRVRERGTVVVAAAGNQADLGIQVPASCRGVISVAGADEHGARAPYSGMGRYIDVAAPGGGGLGVLTTLRVASTDGGGDPYDGHANPYTTVRGTSFAAPYVTGVVALLRSLDGNLSLDAVEAILEQTAVHPDGAGAHSHQLGWGNVRAGAAVRLLEAGGWDAPRRHPAIRLSAGTGTTAPVDQAVAVSRGTFASGNAAHAVIAREDDFADALAGSSLAYGVGPLLFAPPVGGLPSATRAELVRAVPRGRTVYLLGGHAALDPDLESELSSLGYRPVRLAGRVREETAVAVAREMGRPGGVHTEPAVILATRGNWPDAVAAGALGSLFGLPVLLTAPGELHGATAAYLRGLRDSGRSLRTVYVVGGQGVVSGPTAEAAGTSAGADVLRLGGATRDQTAVAVGQELIAQLRLGGASPSYAIAIDLERGDSFAHALSASALAGNTGGVFVPIRGTSAPQRITAATAAFACRLRADGIVAGDVDLLPPAIAEELVDVLEGSSPRC